MSRVTDIRYIGYGVTAFEAEREFYVSNWGLQEVQATQDIAWLRTVAGNEPCAVRLRRAEVNHLVAGSVDGDVSATRNEAKENGR